MGFKNEVKEIASETPAVLKKRWFQFIVVSVIAALSTFLLVLVDNVNFRRSAKLNGAFDINFNISINTWGLLLLICGVLYIAFIAFIFFKPIEAAINASVVKRSGKEMDTKGFVLYIIGYCFGVAVLVAGLALFSALWFPWDTLVWKGEVFKNFIATAGVFLLILLIVAIVVLVVTIIIMIIKHLVHRNKKEAK